MNQGNPAPVPLLDVNRAIASFATKSSAQLPLWSIVDAFCTAPEVTALEQEVAKVCAVPHAIGLRLR